MLATSSSLTSEIGSQNTKEGDLVSSATKMFIWIKYNYSTTCLHKTQSDNIHLTTEIASKDTRIQNVDLSDDSEGLKTFTTLYGWVANRSPLSKEIHYTSFAREILLLPTSVEK